MEVGKCPFASENKKEEKLKKGVLKQVPPAAVVAAAAGHGRVWALLPELCPPWLGMARPFAALLLSLVPISSHPLPLGPSSCPHQSLRSLHLRSCPGVATPVPCAALRGSKTPLNHPHHPQIIPIAPKSSPVLQSSVPPALRWTLGHGTHPELIPSPEKASEPKWSSNIFVLSFTWGWGEKRRGEKAEEGEGGQRGFNRLQ